MCKFLKKSDVDCIHIADLPDRNKTIDNRIHEDRIVITKDNDFLQSYLIKNIPPKLLLVNTGNIANTELLGLKSIID